MTVLACGCREETCQITTGTGPRHNSSRSDLETHHSRHNKTQNNNGGLTCNGHFSFKIIILEYQTRYSISHITWVEIVYFAC